MSALTAKTLEAVNGGARRVSAQTQHCTAPMVSTLLQGMTMKMPPTLLGSTALAIGLLLGAHAGAQTMSSATYRADKTQIKTTYKADKVACGSQSGNAKDICVEEAKGKEAIAIAELDHNNKPTARTAYKVAIAKGKAVYEVAREKCDDLSGNPKSVCVKEAKATWVAAKADATVQMKTTTTNADASSAKTEVRADATADKRAADLKVAEQKCDAMASTAKDTCMASAKAQFGKL